LLSESQKLRPLKRFLAIAGIWHIAFVLAVFLVGRAQLAPKTIDRNGIGISFAIDTHSYRIESEDMAKLIWQGKIRDWTRYNASFHVKLYSLSFALVAGLVGPNILGAEPLNLLYYLLILALTFFIASEVFDAKIALLASGAVALWPSLLLHTTQLLRDALFIPALLLLVLSLLLTINRNLSLKKGLLVVIPGTLGALTVWLCRGDSWEIVIAILIFGAAICFLAQLRQRSFSIGSTIAIAVILLLSACMPRLVPTYRQSSSLLTTRLQPDEPPPPRWNVARRLALLRHNFIVRYPLAGSNIDTDVELRETTDVLRYLPRAALIGFLAPFPNLWMAKGEQVGVTGRLIAGGEMFLLYIVMAAALLVLVRERRRLSLWLLFGAAAAGCIALGFVVVNISTLYRMRYVYFILLIILGMKGLVSWLPQKPAAFSGIR
jgi:hypothetical protein